MAAYGTKEYYDVQVRKSEIELDLLHYSICGRIQKGEVFTVKELYEMSKVFVEAFDEYESRKEKLNACIGNAEGSKESTEV